jgi:hypothetical protein
MELTLGIVEKCIDKEIFYCENSFGEIFDNLFNRSKNVESSMEDCFQKEINDIQNFINEAKLTREFISNKPIENRVYKIAHIEHPNFFGKEISAKKFKKKCSKAINSYALGIDPEDVLAVFDDTIFGKADEGFLVTKWGIVSDNYQTIFFSQIVSCKHSEDHYLEFKLKSGITEKRVCFYDDKKVIELYFNAILNWPI